MTDYSDPDLGFKLVHREDKEHLRDLMRGGRALEEAVALRWCRKDGTMIWIEQNNVPRV